MNEENLPVIEESNSRCEKCHDNKADHLSGDKLLCTDCYSAECDHIYEEVRESR